MFGQSLGKLSQTGETVRAELVEDRRQHLSQLLGLSVTRDGKSVRCQRRLDFWVVKVDDCSLVREHVHLQSIYYFRLNAS